jgi:hypothetical protein
VAMPDRRSAPIFAAAAAFVLVLAFGKLFGSSSGSPVLNPSGSATPTPAATATSSPTASPKPGSGKVGSTITTSPSALVDLTVVATGPFSVTGGGTSDQTIPAQVLPEGGNAVPVPGALTLSIGANGASWKWIPPPLDVGIYQVCLQLPPNLKAVGGVSSDPQLAPEGFFCKKVRLESAPQTVSFKLVTG